MRLAVTTRPAMMWIGGMNLLGMFALLFSDAEGTSK
jgi:hypothetical protein